VDNKENNNKELLLQRYKHIRPPGGYTPPGRCMGVSGR